MKNFIIAIDGTAASGKGSLAKLLAKHYNLRYMDTGLCYRAVALAAITQNFDFMPDCNGQFKNQKALIDLARTLDFSNLNTNSDQLAQEEVGIAASQIATIAELRAVLIAKQQQFAYAQSEQQVEGADLQKSSRAPLSGAVLDGRDIGSVVCPNADVKLYVDASSQVRAERRLKQLQEMGLTADFQKILDSIIQRDERDKNRPVGALRKMPDSHLINNTKLNLEESFQVAKQIIDPIIMLAKS